MPRARCVDPEPSHELETVGEVAAGRLYRLRAATSLITPDIARRLKSKNRASEQPGAVYFCFFPPRTDDEDGIGRFFRHWGGEALYVCHEDDPITSPTISCVGRPCIVDDGSDRVLQIRSPQVRITMRAERYLYSCAQQEFGSEDEVAIVRSIRSRILQR